MRFLQRFMVGWSTFEGTPSWFFYKILGDMCTAPQRDASRTAPRFRAAFLCHMCVSSHVAQRLGKSANGSFFGRLRASHHSYNHS